MDIPFLHVDSSLDVGADKLATRRASWANLDFDRCIDEI
jgi:hypothetical protein